MCCNNLLYCIIDINIRLEKSNLVNYTKTETVKINALEAVSDMLGYLDTIANRCTSESQVPTQKSFHTLWHPSHRRISSECV